MERSIRHLAFFEALAEMDETQSDWRATSAGLVVLRLFDAWVDEGRAVVAPDAWGLRAVREAVSLVDANTPVRRILAGIVDAMVDADAVDIPRVAPRLMAYGRALDYDGRWQLAGDVFRTLVQHAHPIEDADLAADANMQLGYCARMMGDFAEADAAYRRAEGVASEAGDVIKLLRARLGDAKVAIDRGNLPYAERKLEDAIGEAKRHALTELWATALHDRAHLAIKRGDFELSIRLGYQALESFNSPAARDRVLNDLAAAFQELGVTSAARDANLVLAATAQEQYVRWTSTINLLELAAIDRCEPVFEQYRRELADAELPPLLQAYYHLYVGRGHQAFGHYGQAAAAFDRAAEIAAQRGLNQVAFEIERSAAALAAAAKVPSAEERPMSEEVRDVARAITRLRERVLAGA